MGKKGKYTVDYFPHYCHHGPTLFIIEQKFGNDGYSVFWKTLEILGMTEYHFIDCRTHPRLSFLMAKMGIDNEKLTLIYNMLAGLGSIDKEMWEQKVIYSQNFVDRLSELYARRTTSPLEKADICKHLGLKCSKDDNKIGENANIVLQSKVKERKGDKSKEVYGEYKNVLLSDIEYEKLNEIDGLDIESWIVQLDEYVENTGKKYRSHYLTILQWFRKHQNDMPKPKIKILGYEYKCPVCQTPYKKRELKGESDFDTYRCTENKCCTTQLMDKSMVGPPLKFVKKLTRKEK
ncbi:Lin1244/Lin1753 domain-containing protein [Candidatus Neomarinimicrobiota bacterium]